MTRPRLTLGAAQPGPVLKSTLAYLEDEMREIVLQIGQRQSKDGACQR